VAEWFKAPVLKTGVPARVPWVRIPPLPPESIEIAQQSGRISFCVQSGVQTVLSVLAVCAACYVGIRLAPDTVFRRIRKSHNKLGISTDEKIRVHVGGYTSNEAPYDRYASRAWATKMPALMIKRIAVTSSKNIGQPSGLKYATAINPNIKPDVAAQSK
jgi:hypothetical protein